MSESANPMLSPAITKVTVNIGVGEGGRRLQLAEKVLEVLTGMTPSRTLSTKTNRDLGTRKGAPIGCKVTIRDADKVQSFLKDAFWVSCLLYTSPSPRDEQSSRMPSSA